MIALLTKLDLCHTLMFLVTVLIFVYPPAAIVSSGLTLENIFSFLLGSENSDFVGYHVRRSSLNLQVHSLLPLLYYLSMSFTSESISLFEFKHVFWQMFVTFSIMLPISVALIITRWYQDKWQNHPICRQICIRSGSINDQEWRQIAMEINRETKSIEKFVSGTHPNHRLFVTENWLLLTRLYGLDLAHHHNDVAMLKVEQCNLLSVSHEDDIQHHITAAAALATGSRSSGLQFLKIAVLGRQHNEVYFHFQVNSVEYEEIKGRINAPIRHAKGVIVQMTLGEQFIKAFRTQVKKNKRPSNFGKPKDFQPETCIGCSEKPANVKLFLNCCDDESHSVQGHIDELDSPERQCKRCNCRPMWCVSCMGRWFASRQLVAEYDPGTWMSRKASCPSCRSIFCVLDVFLIDNDDNEINN